MTWAESVLKKHIEEDLGLTFDKDTLYDKFMAIDRARSSHSNIFLVSPQLLSRLWSIGLNTVGKSTIMFLQPFDIL